MSERDSTFCEEVFEAVAKSPKISVKRLANALNASKSEVYQTLKVNFKMKTYKFHRSEDLSDS